jgi:hypothetical protein
MSDAEIRRRADLRMERLVEQAEAETGLRSWGEPELRPALEILCRSAREETQLGGLALQAFAANLRRLLTTRLRLYADRARHPEIPRQQIRAPLIVTGLPRGGTTILHALLAQDPAARSPLTWEVAAPSPPPRRESYDTDPRIAASEADIETLEPEFRAMHAVGARLPEECNAFTTLAFASLNFWASTPLPAYVDWLLSDEADLRPAYALHRHVLQHLQAFAPGAYWVLKSPPHLLWLDRLLETYPDARIVVTHRDPAQLMPSNASLIAFIRRRSGAVDPHAVGAEQLRVWGTAMQRLMAVRASGAHADQFVDVYYADFVRAPLETVRRIYGHFGMALRPEAERRMARFMAENRQEKHGKHIYTAGEFGMDAASLRSAFADYVERYRIPLADAAR